MKKPLLIVLIILVVLLGIILKVVNFYSTTRETIQTVTSEVSDHLSISKKNISFVTMDKGIVDGVAVDVLEMAPAKVMTACGKADTSIYTVISSMDTNADGIEYVSGIQYKTITGANSTISEYRYYSDEFYNNLDGARLANPGQWDWIVATDPVLSAQLSSSSNLEDEFLVKWTYIAGGKESDYGEASVKPLQCSDGHLYISSPFDTEKFKTSPVVADGYDGFFQVGVYYKDVLLDSTTLVNPR